MKSKLFAVLIFAGATCALAQEKGDVVYRTAGAVGAGGLSVEVNRAPVVGAPYSATTNNEHVQVLSDGNRIVQTSTGTTARDSQGRTRQDTALPAIGNLSAAEAPHLVFIQDPVAQKSYTLNLTEKTAHEMAMLSFEGKNAAGEKFFVQMSDKEPTVVSGQSGTIAAQKMKLDAEAMAVPLQVATDDFGPQTIATQKITAYGQKVATENAQVSTEDLGTQTMEGVVVTGVRTTRTIPAGQIGNEQPIHIVTEVWTSPELKTVVMSKRSDPRMGEQIFRLTNITRTEPDALLFSVPADFRIVEGPQPMINYRPNR
jgi:hypothetical protein